MDSFIKKDTEINYFIHNKILTIVKINSLIFDESIIDEFIEKQKCNQIDIYINTKNKEIQKITN